MTDPRIEQVCRRLCKANGIDPDAPMLVPDNDRGGEEAPMWQAYMRPAVEHIAVFDYLALELLDPETTTPEALPILRKFMKRPT